MSLPIECHYCYLRLLAAWWMLASYPAPSYPGTTLSNAACFARSYNTPHTYIQLVHELGHAQLVILA